VEPKGRNVNNLKRFL